MSKLILLSAGGTGGHLFPAEALAHELRDRGYRIHLVTDRRAQRFSDNFPADEVHVVPSATITSKNPVALIRTGIALFRGLRDSGRLLARIKPDAVVGFGGYPTLPPLMAATRAAMPAMIQEQNAVMGRANRFLAGRVDVIAGGFLEPGTGVHGDKIITTGNPVRPDVLEAAKTPYKAPAKDDDFHLLVFGGSQGARFFSEILPATIDQLPEDFRRRLRITQQARPEDKDDVEAYYRDNGIKAEVSPFFAGMAKRMANAHLVISRSGASTVSELSTIGRPAILVPFPHALDHDQAANAAALEKKGGARVVRQSELTPQSLANVLSDLAGNPEQLATMARQARETGRPDAARLLADLVEDMASGQSPFEKQKDQQ
ncbi:MAG: undecaprenyldiphospho-muramoylpentapeptide beta-N-acetylglucosaminyltransferase [Alphaproteobacteria bacterium]|nr:undecaprenyldiphospho-muramoylpentapeptide beta-N-acetylglucosaminyltransferase [Alphaproteobacteria bacterium]